MLIIGDSVRSDLCPAHLCTPWRTCCVLPELLTTLTHTNEALGAHGGGQTEGDDMGPYREVDAGELANRDVQQSPISSREIGCACPESGHAQYTEWAGVLPEPLANSSVWGSFFGQEGREREEGGNYRRSLWYELSLAHSDFIVPTLNCLAFL